MAGAKVKYIQATNLSVLACALLAGTLNIAAAGSLAGSEGHKNFNPVMSQSSKDPCNKAYKAYVAASGHSAYATTPYYRTVDLYIICGAGLNAATQKAAEERALKSCETTRSHYKVTSIGICQVAASK